MQAVRVVVSGRVQGVGFRGFVLRIAGPLGLDGWVRNAGDGSVELEARGEESRLRALVGALHTGPGAARVEQVEERWFEAPEGPHGFRVVG